MRWDRHPHAFSSLHVSMIRAGEKGGFLEEVLSRVSEFVRRQDELRNKFIGSMIYPSVLMLGGLTAITVLMMVVVPKIRPLLEQQNLPWPTIVIFGVADALQNHYVEVLGVALVLIVAVDGFLSERFRPSALGADSVARRGRRQDLHDGCPVPLLPDLRHAAGERDFRSSTRCVFRRTRWATRFWPKRSTRPPTA